MKKVIFIGQAMPRVKRHPHDWPTLNAWLYPLGLTDAQIKANFFYSALVDYFPGSKDGSHLVPTEEEITKERPRLIKTIKDFSPDIIVPIGKLSISYCLNRKVAKLEDAIGQTFSSDPYLCLGKDVVIIPLPHPSGASTWRHKPENKFLLNQALTLLGSQLNLKVL